MELPLVRLYAFSAVFWSINYSTIYIHVVLYAMKFGWQQKDQKGVLPDFTWQAIHNEIDTSLITIFQPISFFVVVTAFD